MVPLDHTAPQGLGIYCPGYIRGWTFIKPLSSEVQIKDHILQWHIISFFFKLSIFKRKNKNAVEIHVWPGKEPMTKESKHLKLIKF